jgi:hypothetical protein
MKTAAVPPNDCFDPEPSGAAAILGSRGTLVVYFSLRPSVAFAQEMKPASAESFPPPGSLKTEPFLDSWIRIDAAGRISVFTGKAELGQGIKTALIQVAAEELFVDPGRITLVTADTERTPNEGTPLAAARCRTAERDPSRGRAVRGLLDLADPPR